MGSFGLCFGDATDSEGSSWWNGFSRLESRRGANAVVRESGRLPSIRAGFRDTLDRSPMPICTYAVMPNHWHLLLWPECDGELTAFMQRLTITHVRRWQEHRGYAGLGHVYQGRYKSFPVESDEHFWVVARYVERNALRANLVLRAEEWRWSSLWQRCHPPGEERSLLAAWPIDMPVNWLERVNQTDDAQELEALRRSVHRGCPLGQPEWQNASPG
ncbi:MAG: transposase [Isosphaeraceae bacterium]